MDGHSSSGPVTVLLLAALMSSALGRDPPYFEEGKPLVLTPPKHGTAITSVEWQVNGNLVAEWVNNKLELYRSFQGRTELNQSTAQLTVNNATQSDGGEYSVEINNELQSQVYTVKVIKKVTKPWVKVRTLTCGPTSSECTFTCEGDTAGTQPLTYSWRNDSGEPDKLGEWGPEQQSMDLIIYNDEKMMGVKQISCRMKNPVSEVESDRLDNPMYPKDLGSLSTGGLAAIIIIVVILVVVLAGLVYWKLEIIKTKFHACIETESSRGVEPSTVIQPLNEIQ